MSKYGWKKYGRKKYREARMKINGKQGRNNAPKPSSSNGAWDMTTNLLNIGIDRKDREIRKLKRSMATPVKKKRK